ncbi:GHKL domain-containing protein [Lachnospiraceae bacterium]|nr:GHKL domain-containing protein [Lachnospiraceae bacterium]
MEIEQIVNYITVVISDINFMLNMLIIVMVSACFLGRYVVITRRMVIATCGILIFQLILTFGGDFLFSKIYPVETEYINGLSAQDIITADNPMYAKVYLISNIYTYVLNIGVFVYAFVFYLISYKEKRVLRAIESTICLFLYYMYVNTILQYTYTYMRGGDFELLNNVYSTLGGRDNLIYMVVLVGGAGLVSLILLFILYFLYYKRKRYYVVRIRDRILFVVWLVIFSIFPAIPGGGQTDAEKYQLLGYVFGSLLPILGGIAPVLLVMNAAEKSLKEKNEYQETYLAAELEYIEQYKRTQTETRAFRHDIINNLSLTDMMLDEGKTEEASAHIKQLLGNVRALSPSIITGDEMLDCIVAMKADKMKEKAIQFSSDGVVDGGLHMKAMDICSIFANALDNAIEAADKTVPDAWVDLKIKRNDKFAIIKISNSAVGKVDVEKLFMTSGYTSKKDTEHHGFGLSNIRRTVEDYDGLIKAESDEKSFSLSIMIPRQA